MKNFGSGLKATLESILFHGVRRLPDRSLRLQLLVFNCAMLLGLALTLAVGAVVLIAAQPGIVAGSILPILILFALLHLLKQQGYFLPARILYVALAVVGVAVGVYLYGRESQLTLYCLVLALLPFLLFQSKEWPWIAFGTAWALSLFVMIEFDLLPLGQQPLPVELPLSLRLIFSTGAFVGVMAPSLLICWQADASFRRELRLSRMQARDETFAAIGRLAAGAAHEINNPLAIVQLTLDNIENSHESMKEPSVQLRIRRAYEAIQRIHHILQKLLASSLDPSSTAESFPVTEIAQLIGERCRRFVQGQGIRLMIRRNLPPDYRVLCHRQSLMDVVDSLIHNALEAMAGQSRPQLTLSLTCENRHFLVKVEDNGPGVSEAQLRSLFTPFFTSKESGGLGLSLYSARCIAQQYGGDLICESGTNGRFVFLLPLELS